MSNNPIDTYIAGMRRGFTIAQTRATARVSDGPPHGVFNEHRAYMVWDTAQIALEGEIRKHREMHDVPAPARPASDNRPLIASVVSDAVESVLRERGIPLMVDTRADLAHRIGQRAHAWIVEHNLHRRENEPNQADLIAAWRAVHAATKIRPPERRKAYAVLTTDGNTIRGVEIFSEPSPTIKMNINGETTQTVLFETEAADYLAAQHLAYTELGHNRWAWAGVLKTENGRWYRDARPAQVSRDLGPTGDDERALRVGAEELLRAAGKRFDAYKADPRCQSMPEKALEHMALLATILHELEGYVSK